MLFYVSLGCLLFVIFIFAFGDKLKSELVRGIGNSLAIPCLLFGFLGLLISSFVTFRISISNDPADLINVHTKIIAVSNVNSVKEKEYYYDCFQEESNGEFKEHSYYWDDVTLIYRKNVLPKIETIQYTGQAGNWKFSPFYKIKTIKKYRLYIPVQDPEFHIG